MPADRRLDTVANRYGGASDDNLGFPGCGNHHCLTNGHGGFAYRLCISSIESAGQR